MELLEELHVTPVVKSCVLLSENVPVALSCWPEFTAMEGSTGEIVRDTSAATFSEAEPLTVPAVAVSVLVPMANAFATPVLPTELLMTATEELDDVQMTDWRVWVLPSLNVPVATNCWVCPGIRKKLA